MSKINNALRVFLFVLVALVVFSCKTTPKAEPVEEAPPSEVSTETKPIEQTATPAKDDKTAQIADLNTAIEKARQRAIESGAQTYVPEILSDLDAQLDGVKKSSESSQDKDAVLAEGKKLLDYYEALEKACLALTLQARIEGFSFQSYDMKNYNLGVDSLNNAEKTYVDGGESYLVKDEAQKAYTAFATVLDTAFMSLAQAKRKEVVAVRADADAIKAGAADKSGYNSAMLKFSSAETKMTEKDYEGAYNLYVDSHNALLEIYERVLQKRKAAEEAIARVKSKTEAVDRYALEADAIAPLPSQEAPVEAE